MTAATAFFEIQDADAGSGGGFLFDPVGRAGSEQDRRGEKHQKEPKLKTHHQFFPSFVDFWRGSRASRAGNNHFY
jgi:hypothetical protein